ncbi:MAG: peptide chain release factor 1 [Chloroflexi bacterium]|nr:peptide chain release factor 1 [Chloroflexota bacterium]
MWSKLEAMESRHRELEELLARPEVATDSEKVRLLAQELGSLQEAVAKYREHKRVAAALEEARALAEDAQDEDIAQLAREEMASLGARREALEAKLEETLAPRDPRDQKNVIVEIRAGTGGDEASLFATDLMRMYMRYAESRGWTTDLISSSESGLGGFKEVIFEVKGKGAYSRLKYESGVHRVQRVPLTEASGRIHTSTATVAVLPEAEEVDVDISPDDLRIDIFHSGGAGGQNVNKVATAVRLTHLPTGMVVTCQDERSQLRNKTKALAVLRARLLATKQREQEEKMTSERRAQVGTAERAEKVRTYNFLQDRVTDHRVGLSRHNLPSVLEGDLEPFIDALVTQERGLASETQRT